MPKSTFNSMVVGNSGMLGCLDSGGELIRLFWPDIDFSQHIDRLKVGVTCPERWHGTRWLDAAGWQTEQFYAGDTNIAVTVYQDTWSGIRITQQDFVLMDKPVLVRNYKTKNFGEGDVTCGFVMYSSGISTHPHLGGVLFDQELSSMIHYRHGYYLSLSSTRPVSEYQLGADALACAGRADLAGSDTVGMMPDGALRWEGSGVKAGGIHQFELFVSMADNLKSVKSLAREMAGMDPQANLEAVEAAWHDYVKNARQISTGNEKLDSLYRRSLLVFALMTNKRTGALLAAPEIDEEFTRCGRYAYCWGRDAAFITGAMDKCGLTGDVKAFYRWAARVQEEDGSWQQRYHMDGNLAPSWGLQIDEGGSILWGILEHYKATGDRAFLEEMWPCVRKGVEFLLRHMDEETGVPWLSFDLWEERLGEHAYSTAAVCAGIEAGAEIAGILGDGQKVTTAEHWGKAAARIKKALEEQFWQPDWNRFARSIRVKLNGWGEEHTDQKVWLKINDRSIVRDFTNLDGTIDISLLGLCVPFGLYAADDPRMVSTAAAVEQALSTRRAGGLMRYEHDHYIGGNPWILTTLWAALYHIEKGSGKQAEAYLEWAANCATPQGLLPEQADGQSGAPAWVIPLTWSHAMFVLVLDALYGER